MKSRKRRFRKHVHRRQINSENQIEEVDIPQEDIDLHPELSRETTKDAKPVRFRRQRFVPKELVEKYNQPNFTNLVLGLAIVLGLIYIVFGFLGILAIFGYREDSIWNFYQLTEILGWNQLKITGFVFVIIGIVMIWSVPLYVRDKTQQGDSYLVIASGLGIVFGVIYLLIIIADVLDGLISAISESTSIEIETFFYIPIMLAIVAIPLFRILVIRHMVVLPDVGKEIPISSKWKKHHRRENHFNGKWRSHWRRNMRHKKKEHKKNKK